MLLSRVHPTAGEIENKSFWVPFFKKGLLALPALVFSGFSGPAVKKILMRAMQGVSKVRHSSRVGLRLRIVLRQGVAFGPGRADLLQGVHDLGSIAAAGRAMGMSYRRAWMLLNATSAEFGSPVVAGASGGPNGGGAQLTEIGRAVLDLYRAMEAKAADAVAGEVSRLQALASGAEGADGRSAK